MLKKIVSLLVIFAMLVPLSSAVAADEPTSQPTIEEILNAYHDKAFDAQNTSDSSSASTWSRSISGSSQTLEEETVDTLTAAGYEAYNVTSDNYTSLEADLNTDFDEFGLDPDGSYIIVIHGEEGQSTSSSSRIIGDPGGSDIVRDDGGLGGNSYYEYTYDNRTFKLRNVTVTASTDSDYAKDNSYHIIDLEKEITYEDILENLLDEVICIALDSITDAIPFGTIASMCGLSISNFIGIDQPAFKTLTLDAGSSWSRTYTQVYV